MNILIKLLLFTIFLALPTHAHAQAGSVCWDDSLSVNGKCYCQSNYDHNENGYLEEIVQTPAGPKTVREVCEAHANFDIPSGTIQRYNDVQCGNGPKNAASDEDSCPAIPSHSDGSVYTDCGGYNGPRCREAGPTWDLSMFGDVQPTDIPVEPTATPINACGPTGDIDCSGEVNILDLSRLLSNFGLTGPNEADLDNSLEVNTFDLSRLLSNYGSTN